MQEEIIEYLICPHQENKKICQGDLIVDNVFNYFNLGGVREIRDGYLKCNNCGTRFPIFYGIPALLIDTDMTNFLRWNITHLNELSKKYGQIKIKMIEDAISWLLKRTPRKERSRLLHVTPKASLKRISSPKDGYFVNSYDSLLRVMGENSFYGPILKYYAMSPYGVLRAFLKSHLCSNNAILEVGCHAGGFLRLLSPYSKFVFGLDVSFLDLFDASRILKHFPRQMKNYVFSSTIDGVAEKRRILVNKCMNVTLIAGDAANIPIKKSCLSAVVSNNVFDIINKPIVSLEEAERVLSKNGIFLFSSCYGGLRLDERKKLRMKKNQRIWGKIKEVIEHKMKVLEVHDNVPWLVRDHDHSLALFKNHCFCAKKVHE